jgi:hypothetical protein
MERFELQRIESLVPCSPTSETVQLIGIPIRLSVAAKLCPALQAGENLNTPVGRTHIRHNQCFSPHNERQRNSDGGENYASHHLMEA